MRSRSASRPHLSLAQQLLVFQLSLLTIVLIAVTAISLEQTRSIFSSGQQRRMLAVAEYSAALPLMRSTLSGSPIAEQQLTAAVASLQTTTGVDQLLVTTPAGVVLASPSDPRLLKEPLAVGPPGSSGAWAGSATIAAGSYVVARVPVLDDSGTVAGFVIAAREYPPWSGLFADAAPNLLAYLGVAGVLGIGGSWWLAARVKRQTLGLEPEEIGRLAEHREAMLHGIREGVVAVDSDGLITLANDSARTLLNLPEDAEGRSIDAVGLDEDAVSALRAQSSQTRDQPLVNANVMLVLNQTTIFPPRSKPEVVTTLRDRTELVTLQQDLGSSMQATDTLRAQTHEFVNRLHTISMLLQLGDADAAVDYIHAVSRDRSELDRAVLERVAEPAVAAMLIAKTSLARERGAELVLSAESSLPRVDEMLSVDLVTVIGNLVDNALDAVTGAARRVVEVEIRALPDAGAMSPSGPALEAVQVKVHDSGPGVHESLVERVFEPGVTSKSAQLSGADHGFGLAIVDLVVTRRSGRVLYRNEDGATFEVTLPVMEVSHV